MAAHRLLIGKSFILLKTEERRLKLWRRERPALKIKYNSKFCEMSDEHLNKFFLFFGQILFGRLK